MLVDEYEQYHNNNNDRTDVVVVSRSGSEELEPEQEPEPEPLANDCTTSLPAFSRYTLPFCPAPHPTSI